MIRLAPVDVRWKHGRTQLAVRAEENDGVTVGFMANAVGAEGKVESIEQYVELVFRDVAQVRYTMAYFYEQHTYGIEPSKTAPHPSPGFYTVVGSTWQRDLAIEDTEGCKHYLVTGANAYIEILAETYQETVRAAGAAEMQVDAARSTSGAAG